MSRVVPVRIVASAGSAILDAAEWWVANRPKAPDAFAVSWSVRSKSSPPNH